jgi:hypothetical protein
MNALLLALTLACPGDDFAADVARRAELMAADVETMPHVVKAGLEQLAYDARLAAAETNAKLCAREAEVTAQDAASLCEKRREALERLREELRKIIRKNRPAREDEKGAKP